MKKFALLPAVLAVMAVFAIIAVNWYKDNRLPGFTGSASLYVYPGMSSDDVLSLLEEKGIVADSRRLAHVFEAKKSANILLLVIITSIPAIPVCMLPGCLTTAGNLRSILPFPVPSGLAATLPGKWGIRCSLILRQFTDI